METLTIWLFGTADGADRAVHTVKALAKDKLITVHDAAIVSWPVGANKPKTRQLRGLAGRGALSGAFWGMLFGLIFFIPLLGAAIGAATGGVAGALSDYGIDDDLIRRIRDDVTEGKSALFVLTTDAVLDKVHEAFAGEKPELLFTNLTTEQEQALRDLFEDEPAQS